MSKNKHFDARLKEKLGELSTTPLYGSWDTFQKKWVDAQAQGPTVEDTAFDARIKSKLVHVRPVLPSGHWQKLKYRLETIEIFRKKIIIHKIKEVAAVAFFIFTFFNVTNFRNEQPGHTSPVYALNKQPAKSEKTSVPEANERNKKIPTGLNGNRDAVYAASGNSGHGFSKPVSLYQRPTQTISDRLKSKELSKVESTHKAGMQLFAESGENTAPPVVLPIKSGETYSEMATILPMTILPNKIRNVTNRLGIFLSKMHNFILMPFDKVYSVPEFSKSTNNIGVGFSFAKKKDHVEIETGASYARLTYKPFEVRETFASAADVYFETSLKKIRFDLVKIPLNIKYYAIDKNKWKFYALAGTSLNVLALADYTIEENLVKGRPVSPYRFSGEGPRLEDKPFTQGFFDKGNLRENYFVDISLGMGVEIRATRDLYIYCQPSYHAFVFSDEIGIGPNQDKLNVFQVQTGIKWTIH